MSQAVLESMLPQIDALEVKELRHLRQVIESKLRAAAQERPTVRENSGSMPRFLGRVPVKDRSREDAWVAQHRDEYADQW